MEPLLRMSGISKSFPGVHALTNVDFDLMKGELHALVGENGAGKSTLMKILSGLYKVDEGDIYLSGEKIVNTGLGEMIHHGIGVIYQELNLIPYLSVAENIFLGREPKTSIGTIDWAKMHAMTREVLSPFKLDIKPQQKVKALGAAYQQIIEIAKALSLNAEILVMDEPTAALTGHEVDRLFEIIKKLKDDGVSIIYISHRLEEVHLLADRITILRDGERVITKQRGEMNNDEMIKYMVGRVLEEQYPRYDSNPGDVVLEVKGLSKHGICEDVSFSARSGEILGFVGLVGAGRTEIMQTIYGYRKKDAGEIILNGKPIEIKSCQDAVLKGIGLIPEERKQQGLVLGMSVFDNAALSVLDLYSTLGVLHRGKITDEVNTMIDSMNIKTPSVRQLVVNLSGGNQQKVVLAKWFIRHCDVYIFDEPTRGIDVGAKVEIYRLMQNLAKRGAAVIMISSELPEAMNISDRVAVVFKGRIVKQFKKGELNEEQVMEYSLGLHEKRRA
ncbi:sugar ABC transporter ATP-binding protein [Sphaerochaeta halotolerans]|uniref:Sugar ABC transporter ATP-binding protein n=1 Tax=Sphaerochaeta halotolerans TaxID=2293840 RepID=A0A372MDA6_9SPIR|nr:sugar ABC transporter ATP-binding protein [Sphaerochaeta halotolerans]RFU93779.1 sugar ABC transporter ATP-binding protein [Sphaerochaeta halotolerans]